MKVWIFIIIINWNGHESYLADNLKYVFLTEASCKYAIAESKYLKCIELELIQ